MPTYVYVLYPENAQFSFVFSHGIILREIRISIPVTGKSGSKYMLYIN